RGELSLEDLYETMSGTPTVEKPRFGRDSWLRLEHAQGLDMLTRMVEAAELPPHQQQERFGELDREMGPRAKPRPSRMLLQVQALFMLGVFHPRQRHQASVRSLIVLVAAERYRKANGRWPESVDALVPTYLADVPLDPYDGNPVRLRRMPFGITVYCVGPDRTDDGGHIDREAKPEEPGTDIGLRLWDPDRRRQPAPTPPDEMP